LASAHLGLHLERSLDRVDGAAELQEEAVAEQLDDPAGMRGDDRLDDGLAPVGEGLERAVFVAAHHPRIAGHVGDGDGGETALDARFGHAS
jgi:hypothetical protein